MLISTARLLGFLDSSVPKERDLRAALERLHSNCGSGGDETVLKERLARILDRRGHKGPFPAGGGQAGRYTVAGVVATGKPAGVKVDVVATTLGAKRPSDVLASTTTTEHGEFLVTFEAPARPVFRVRFLAGDKVLHVSPPKLATGDDWVEWADNEQPIRRPGLFEVGRALLESQIAEHEGRTLEGLDDSPDASEVLLLAQELGMPEEIVVRHVASARLARKLEVPDAVAFALLGSTRRFETPTGGNGGVPTGLDHFVEDARVHILRKPPSAVMEVIARAIDRGEVSSSLQDALPKVRDSLQDKRTQHLLEQPLAGGSRWRELLAAAGVPDTDLIKVAAALLDAPEPAAWATLAEKLGDAGRAQAIRDALAVGALVDHDARLLSSLIRKGHTTPRTIARLSPAELDAALAQVISDSKERADRLQKVHDHADVRFPGESLLRRRASRLSSDTAAFVNTSGDRFDLMTAHLAGLAHSGALHSESSRSEVVRKELASLQRVARVSSNAKVAEVLLDHKYESAQRIAFTSRAGFTAQMKSAGLSEEAALATHRSAKVRYRATVENYLKFNARANGPRLAAIPTVRNPTARAPLAAGPSIQPAVAPVVPTIPSYDLLFGSQDYCACGQCSSVTGPAAYLVDLLLWLQHLLPASSSGSPSPYNLLTGQATISGIAVTGTTTTMTTSAPHGFQNGDTVAIANVYVQGALPVNSAPNSSWTIANVTATSFTIPTSGSGTYSAGGTARNTSRILGRRPDLTQLLFNCANTETLIPQIDIVCELLEDHIGIGLTPPTPVIAHQTTLSAEAIRAYPEHVNDAVYAALSASTDSMRLPFDFPLEQVRRYLGVKNLARLDLICALPFAPTRLPDSAWATWTAGEFFGLNKTEIGVITTVDTADQLTIWGLAPGSSLVSFPVSQFLARAPSVDQARQPLAYADLVTLLQGAFVQGSSTQTPSAPTICLQSGVTIDLCKTGDRIIQGLDAATLDRIHRLLRLIRHVSKVAMAFPPASTGAAAPPSTSPSSTVLLSSFAASAAAASTWKLADLDILVSAVGGTLDDTCLQSLFVIARLCGQLNLAADEAAAFFADFTPGDQTGLARADGTPRLFSRLFLLRDSSSVAAAPSGSLTSQKASLCGALGLSGGDFDALLKYLTTLNPAADKGDLPSLSNLYRYSRCAHALGLSTADFCALAPAIGDPFSLAVSGRASALLAFTEEIARLVQIGFSGSDVTTLTSSGGTLPLPDPQPLFDALASPAGSWAAAVAQWLGVDTRFAPAFLALPEAAALGHTLRPSITSATVTNGILIFATAAPHNFHSNDPVAIVGVVGTIAGANSPPNTPWTVTVVSSTSFSIPAPSGVPDGAYQTGGSAIDQVTTASIKTVMSTCWRLNRLLQIMNVTPAEIADVVDLFTALPNVWGQFATPAWTPLKSAVSFLELARSTAGIADFVAYLELLQSASPDKGALETALAYALRTDSQPPDPQTIDSFWNVLFGPGAGWFPTALTSLLDATHYGALRRSLAIGAAVGVPASTWATWANVGAASATTGLWTGLWPTGATASSVRSAIRATFPNAAWLAVSASVQNSLRGKRRDALADFILSTPAASTFATPTAAPVGTVSDLSDSLLIDVEMGQCQDTSRVVQGSAAIQLYVQRCFLGMEGSPGLGAASHDNELFDEWAWRQQYQLWVANRLIFLYPENWLNTLARSSATPLFADFQQTVLQNQITTNNVEAAMDSYLEGLENLANLDYLSVGTNYGAASPAVLGVVARTKASPPQYYYRQLVQGQEWSPWEKLSLGAAPAGLTVCQTATRAWIVWPTYIDSADPAQTTEKITIPSAGGSQAPTVSAGVTALRYSWVTRDVSGAWSDARTTSRALLLQTVSKQNFVHSVNSDGQTDPQEFGASTYAPVSASAPSPLERCGTMDIIRDTVQTTMYSNITKLSSNYFKNVSGVPAAADLQHELDLATVSSAGQLSQLEIWTNFVVEDSRMVFAPPANSSGSKIPVSVPLVPEPQPASSIPVSDLAPVALVTPPNSCTATITMFDITSAKAGLYQIQPSAHAFVLGGESWSFLCLSALAAESLIAYAAAITSTTAPFIQPAVGSGVTVPIYGVGSLAVGQVVQIADSSDNGGTYNVANVSTAAPTVTLVLVSGSPSGARIAALAGISLAPVAFNLIPAYHPFAREMTALARSNGLGALYTAATQLDPNDTLRAGINPAPAPYATTFNVPATSTTVRFQTPQEGIDFNRGFPYRLYNYEVFFHAPMLVATQLSSLGQYQDAQAWFHYIFNPFSTEQAAPGAPAETRYWITKPFRQNIETLEQDITRILIDGATQPVQYLDSPLPVTAGTIPYQSLYAPILSRPFDADGVAQGRITAYQKFVVMQYLNNLIAWGDSLYRTGDRENIADAGQIYSLAQKILGPAPSQLSPLPASTTSGPETYSAIVAGDTLVISIDARPLLTVTFQGADTNQGAVIGRVNGAAGFALASPASSNAITLTGIHAGVGSRITVSGAGTVQVAGKLNFPVATTERRELAFDDADWSGGGNVLVDLESTVAPDIAGSVSAATMSSDGPLVHLPLVSAPTLRAADAGSASQALYFCVPPNGTLLQYWGTIEGRLSNIRHCKTLDGTVVATPLLAAPINPQALANAAALGVGVADAIAMAKSLPPPYRFRLTFETAKEYCADVKSLGAQLLAAMEKRDADQLERLRSSHEGRILTCNRNVKNLQRIQELAEISTLQASRAIAAARQAYYVGRSYMNSLEAASETARGSALTLDFAGMTVDALASVLGIIPDFVLGIEGVGGSPTATTSLGGSLFSRIVGAEGQVLSRSAGLLDRAAGMASTQGGYMRRMDDWQFQAGQATLELQQIDVQIAAANLRIAIIDAELHTQTVEEQDWSATDALLRQKFTNTELYNWIVARLTGLYQVAYGDASKMANLASHCLAFELGARIPPIPPFDQANWDGAHAGLLAGEALDGFLRGLSTIHVSTNPYDRWIIQDVPLSLVDGQALYNLRVKGSTGSFKAPGWWFDQRYPNLTNRRIRAVSFSIPCVAGRFAAVDAVVVGPGKTISLSSGQNDFGWDMNSAGDRYVPFEGVDPADSFWSIAIPPDLDVDVATISDVILHVQYSADEGGTSNASLPKTLTVLVDVRAIDPAAWVALVSPTGSHTCTIDLAPILPSFVASYKLGTPTVAMLASTGLIDSASLAGSAAPKGTQVTIALAPSTFSAWDTLQYCLMVVPLNSGTG